MMSNTEGWSNRQLNERIRELESKLEAIKNTLEEVKDKKQQLEKIRAKANQLNETFDAMKTRDITLANELALEAEELDKKIEERLRACFEEV